MGRKTGSKNTGYNQRYQQLAFSMIPVLMSAGGRAPSLRELAKAAGTSVSTLLHYFQSKDGAIAAALTAMGETGAPYLEEAAANGLGELEPSLRHFLSRFLLGWKHGVGHMFSSGLKLGINDTTAGPSFVTEILEPTLGALEIRLSWHQAQGHIPENADLRVAALSLLGPIVLALLHQGPLGGAACRPLDIDVFVDSHLESFLNRLH